MNLLSQMKNRFAKRINDIRPSQSISIASLAKSLQQKGEDVINLSWGEPDFALPDIIKDSAIKAIKEGSNKYTEAKGILSLREAISEKLRNENSLDFQASEIIVTPGAKHAIFCILAALVDQGDEVIIFEPYWLSYPACIKLVGASPVAAKTYFNQGFQPNLNELEKVITKRTKAVIINTPCNPTGAVYKKERLQEIVSLARKHNLFIISDEIYEKILFDNNVHISIGSLQDAKDITLTVNGFSKSFAMTGWRLGYVAGPTPLIEKISIAHQHIATCANSVAQKAGIIALQHSDSIIKTMVEEYKRRRDLVYNAVSAIDGLGVLKTMGTFYFFIKYNLDIRSSELCRLILERARVALVPGIAYGRGGEGHFRLSFTTSYSKIEEALQRIAHFLKEGVQL